MGPHPFTLRQLQYAVAVADAKGFRAAAVQCRVSQPALSAQLLALEGALGTPLFERRREGAIVTPAGEELVARARRLLGDADELLAAGAKLRDPRAGALRIGVIPTVAPYLLPQIAPALKRVFPKLELRWIEERTEAVLQQLERGELDAALIARVPAAAPFHSAELLVDRFLLAAPRGHALARLSGPARLHDLDGETVLLLDESHCLRDQALAACERTSAIEAEFRATSLTTLAQMVASGAGVTLLPELAVPYEKRRGELVTRELVPSTSRTLILAWRDGYPREELLRELAQAIRGR